MSAYWLRDSRLPRSPHYALPAQKMFLCVEMELNMIREFVANLRLLVPGFRATCLAWRRVHSLRRLFSAAVCLLLAVATSTAASPEKTPTNLTPSAISPCISTSVCVTIPGSPLTINVGAQFNYQIYNSDVPGGVGQYYPNDRVLADSGWIVRFSGTNYGFPVSTNSSAGGVGIVGALSSISGGGTADTPYLVTVGEASLGVTGLFVSSTTEYVNGRGYLTKSFTVRNAGATAVTATVFYGSDLYLAGSDTGWFFREPASGAPGGQSSDRSYTILHVPLAPVSSSWSADNYGTVWSQISSGQLSGALGSQSSISDNGAALQWDISIPANSSKTIRMATTFGDIPAEVTGSAVVPNAARLDVTQRFRVLGAGLTATTSVAVDDCLATGANVVATDGTWLDFSCTPSLPGRKTLRLNGVRVTNADVFIDHPTRTGNPSARGIPSINGVSLFNGNFHHQVTDMSVPGKGIPFTLTRSYNSYYWEPERLRGAVDNYKPWRFNWDVRAGYVPNTSNKQIYVELADGSARSFYQPTGTADTNWYPIDQGSFDRIKPDDPSAGYLTFYERNGLKYQFEMPTDNGITNVPGRLKFVKDHSGNTLTVTHDAATRRVSQVTDTMGRVFSFTYTAAANAGESYLQRVTSSAGQGIHGSTWGVEYTWIVDNPSNFPNSTPKLRARIQTVKDLRGKTWTYGYTAEMTSTTLGIGPRVFLEKLTDPNLKVQFQLLHAAKIYGNWGVTRLWVPDGDLDAASSANFWQFDFVAKTAAGQSAADIGTTSYFENTARPPADVCPDTSCVRTAKFDPAGRVMTYAKSTTRVTTNTLTDRSALTAQTYNTASQLQARQSPLANVNSYEYDASNVGWLSASTDAETYRSTRQYKADAALLAKNLLLQQTRVSHQQLTYGQDFDAAGNLTRRTDPGGAYVQITPNGSGQPQQIVDQRLGTTDLGYSATATTLNAGHLTAYTGPVNAQGTRAQENYEYDALGRMLSRTVKVDNTPRYATTRYFYNEAGQTTRIEDPLHTVAAPRVVQMAYDNAGNLQTRTDARGQPTTFTYTAGNRLKQQSATFTTAAGTSQTVYTAYTYDSLGRTKNVRNGNGNLAANNTYDPASGQITARSNQLGLATLYEYDLDDRVIKVTDPAGRATETTYYKNGRVKTVTKKVLNASNVVTQTNTIEYEYDGDGRITKLTDAKNKTKPRIYEYYAPTDGAGAAGRLARIYDGNTDVNGFATRVSLSNYDAAGNPRTIRDPNYNFTFLEYDEYSRESKRTDQNGNVWQTKYDLAGNVIERSAPGTPSRLITTYTYDLANQLKTVLLPGAATPIQFDYDQNGNRIQMTDATGATVYVYDGVNRLVKVTDPQNKVVEFTYDAAGNRNGIKYPNGQWVYYDFDQAERMYRVRPWAGGNTTYTLNNAGQVTLATNGNATTTEMSFDTTGRLTLLDNKSPAVPGGFISHHALTLDNNGNISSAVSTLPLELDVAASTTGMMYDGSNRLLSVTGQAVVHDPAGRITSLLGSTYTYDGRDLITGVSGTSSASYTYNGVGHRVASTIAGSSKRYVFDPNVTNPTMQNVLTETDNSGTPLRHYIYGYGLVSQVDSANAVKHYHFDPTGHTLALTNAAGNITDAYAYTSYGLTTARGDTVNPYRYVGKYGVADDGNGLFHMRARYYRPDIARFLSLDAVTGDVADGQSLNRYAYGLGNPIMMLDPRGYWGESLYDILVGSTFDSYFVEDQLRDTERVLDDWRAYDAQINAQYDGRYNWILRYPAYVGHGAYRSYELGAETVSNAVGNLAGQATTNLAQRFGAEITRESVHKMEKCGVFFAEAAKLLTSVDDLMRIGSAQSKSSKWFTPSNNYYGVKVGGSAYVVRGLDGLGAKGRVLKEWGMGVWDTGNWLYDAFTESELAASCASVFQ